MTICEWACEIYEYGLQRKNHDGSPCQNTYAQCNSLRLYMCRFPVEGFLHQSTHNTLEPLGWLHVQAFGLLAVLCGARASQLVAIA